MKHLVFSLILLMSLSLVLGCEELLGPEEESYDLVVKVVHEGDPVSGALVRVVETGDEAFTNSNGMTRTLRVKVEDNSATLYVKYGQLDTTREIHLSRGKNDVTVGL